MDSAVLSYVSKQSTELGYDRVGWKETKAETAGNLVAGEILRWLLDGQVLLFRMLTHLRTPWSFLNNHILPARPENNLAAPAMPAEASRWPKFVLALVFMMGDGRSCESGYVFRPPNKTKAF